MFWERAWKESRIRYLCLYRGWSLLLTPLSGEGRYLWCYYMTVPRPRILDCLRRVLARAAAQSITSFSSSRTEDDRLMETR